MLFSYTYVPHQMEKMQEFIDFIFFEVWCKAPDSERFNLSLFATKPELHDVMQAFFYSDANGADFFYGHVERIYNLFSKLDEPQIEQFKQWYRGNNNVEKVCANDSITQLVRYADIPVALKDLSDQLSSFFKGLYSQSLLDLTTLRNKIGDIDNHYRSFLKANKAGKCPFCGISDLHGQYHTKREAYDHYLPKALYPFNSINLRNLVPACHNCNSSYKTSKDPAHPVKDPAGGTKRRKVFYPYCTDPQPIEIVVNIAKPDVSALTPQDISIHFGPATLVDEIDTWRDVYGIDERYKAKVLGENDGKYWITQVLDEWQEEGRSPEAFLQILAKQTLKSPFAEANFLKMPFLEACRAKGVFDAANPL
ncbi:HNH endonuclease [Bradyrhizobium sp. CCGE-LA001]|uniref:HNH endonuclease n=1 Tax=Bradyrhizobium sp. CCGE-LA001 TaxID=1223566 RepID=UPI000745AFFC|nr:HNH endonuclease [Bradyrhizobium sp. CCGE-LA001]AMA60594.1 hypothetical protein BCCGELA001_33220 [Bradyrhizobium sp. CCGE-LA001]